MNKFISTPAVRSRGLNDYLGHLINRTWPAKKEWWNRLRWAITLGKL